MSLVVDASATLPWLLEDESSDYADHLLQTVLDEGALVPAIWPDEVSNALVMCVRRGRLSEEDLAEAVELLGCLPMEVISSPYTGHMTSVMAISQRYGTSVYDASYLNLANQKKAHLCTLDRPMRTAASQMGVPIWLPPQ